MIALRTLLAISVITLGFMGMWSAQPVKYGLTENEVWQPDSAADMRATAADIDQRLDDGEHVFTVLPEYYSLSEHYPPYTPRIYHLVSPQHGKIERYNRTDHHDRMRERFVNDLENGTIALIIMTVRTDYILDEWPEAREAFRENYCRVLPRPEVYKEISAVKRGVHLYEYAPGQSDCINRTTFNSNP